MDPSVADWAQWGLAALLAVALGAATSWALRRGWEGWWRLRLRQRLRRGRDGPSGPAAEVMPPPPPDRWVVAEELTTSRVVIELHRLAWVTSSESYLVARHQVFSCATDEPGWLGRYTAAYREAQREARLRNVKIRNDRDHEEFG